MTGRDPSKDKKPKPRKPSAAVKGAVPPPSPGVVEPGPDDKWPDDPAVTGGVDDPAAYALPNPKQERFAQEIATGKPLHEAYLNAGYTGNPSNARRLRADEAVWKRIKALQAEIGRRVVEKVATEISALSYSREDAMREADAVLKMAMAMGHSGPAGAIVKLKAELMGIANLEAPPATADQGHVAKSLEDPQVVQDILNIRRARKLALAGGTDVTNKAWSK